MNREQRALGRAADRMVNLDSPAYADERERAVSMEAVTFGSTLGIYASLVVALVAALLGSLLVPVLVLGLMAVPSWSALWYAGRRKVDIEELAHRARGRTKATIGAVVFGGMLLTIGAMAYTVLTGHGLVPTPAIDVAGPDATGVGSSLVQGGIVGGVIGLLIAVVALTVTHWRGPRRREMSDEED